MTRGSRIAGPAAALLFAAAVAHAQPPREQAPPDSILLSDVRIVQVVTGGSWVEGERRGHYRVVVLRDGGDVPHHTTYVQWLERHGLTERVSLLQSADLQTLATHWYAILSPEIRLSRGIWYLNVDVQDGPARPSRRRVTFVLGPPGHIRLR